MKTLWLKTKILCLTAVVTSCNYNVKHATPEFLDPSKGYARIYAARSVTPIKCGDPAYEFYYTGENIAIAQMTGHICLAPEQAQEILRYYNEWLRKDHGCP